MRRAAALSSWPLALAAVLSAAPAASQEKPAPPPPELEVVQEWFPEDVAASIGTGLPGWLPVYLEIRNRGSAPAQVRLEGLVAPMGGGRRVRADRAGYQIFSTIEVQPGPPRRAFLYLHYDGPSQDGGTRSARIRASLVQRGQALERFYERQYTITSLPGSAEFRNLSILVCGENAGDAAMLLKQASSAGRGFGARSPSAVRRLIGNLHVACDPVAERMLPDDAIGLHSTGILVLRNLEERQLEPSQVEAIRQWVYLGGRVIFVPSRSGEVFATRLARALLRGAGDAPPKVDERFRPAPELGFLEEGDEAGVFRLSQTTAWSDDENASAPSLVRIEPALAREASERSIVAVSKNHRGEAVPGDAVYRERAYGSGRVGFLTFDDLSAASDAGLDFRSSLWGLILASAQESRGGLSPWAQEVAVFENGRLVDFIKKGLSADLGIWFFGAMIVVYLLVIGPGMYFLLKRLGKLPWVVWVEPVVVVLYVGAIFLTGYLTRGVLTQTRTVSVLHWREGEDLAHKESYLGVFSSEEARYQIHADADRWLRPVFANAKEAVGVSVQERAGAEGKRSASLRDFRLDIWQTGVFAGRDVVPFKGGIRLNEELGEGDGDATGAPRLRSVEVANETAFKFRESFLVLSRSELVPLGALAPGGVARAGRDRLARPVPVFVELKKRSLSDRGAEPATARESALESVEDPLAGDALARETLQRVLSGDLFLRLSGRIAFIGILDRSDRDFTLGQGSNLMHRIDLMVMYRRER
jgi:hypothetical protein